MKGRWRWALLGLIVCLGLGMPLKAMASTPQFEGKFSVKAQIPANQIDKEAAYFDLLVEPGQNQKLVVQVWNPGEEPLQVEVETLTAFTNRNGFISYSGSGRQDETLPWSFEELTEVQEPLLEISPNSIGQAVITLSLPEEEWDGLLLGSIRIAEYIDPEALEEESGIVHRLSYSIAVRLRENMEEVEPEVLLGEIETGLVNHKAAIIANIRNTSATIVEDVNVSAKVVRKEDGVPVISLTQEEVELAPNTIFPLSLVDEAGYGFEQGDYIAQVMVEYEGNRQEFAQEFEIVPAVAEYLNDNAVNQYRPQADNKEKGETGWMLPVGIAGVGLLLIIGIGLLRKRGKQTSNH